MIDFQANTTCRLDLPIKQQGSPSEAVSPEATQAEEAPRETATEISLEPDQQPGSDIPQEAVAKFIKLPARPPLKARAVPQAPQVGWMPQRQILLYRAIHPDLLIAQDWLLLC